MKSKKLIVYAFFAAYLAAACYLLFFMRRSVWEYYTYGEYFRKNTNFVPFLTIKEYIGYLKTDDEIFGDVSFVNIWGNFIVLLPAGIFFPAVWKKQRSFAAFALTITAVTVGIESVQFLTMCGSCDIDDLILNVTGALLGFWFTKLKIVRRLTFTDIGFEKGE